MKRIVPIPKRLLCPKCGKGRLKSADVDSDQIQIGEYQRRCQMVCSLCKYSKSMLETFIGVEVESNDSKSKESVFPYDLDSATP